MPLAPENVADFVALTLPAFKKVKWTDISLQYQSYVSSTLIDEKKVIEDGGPTIKFQVQVRNTGTATVSGLYHQDTTKVEDVMVTGTVNWACQTANWSFDIDEDLFQSDRETIVKLLTVRDHDCLNGMAELQEELFWNAPTGTTDLRPMGIPFWIQGSATTGFNGGNPTGYSAGCAGISSVDYPKWRNYTDTFSQVTTDDFVKKVKKALWSTNFQAPVPHPELGFGKSDYTMYTTYSVTETCERLAETRNDNLGSDLAKYIGVVTIGGVPLKAVPYLTTNDTTDPVYGVNWKTLRPYVKKGCSMRRSPPKPAPLQHNVRNVFIDNWMNWVCINRRANFKLYRA